MKPSFKTTTLIAAIGTIAYTLYVLVRYVIHEYFISYPYRFDLWDDICVRLIFDIPLLSLIIAGIGLLKYRPSKAASKTFRIFTNILFLAYVATLVLSDLYTIQIFGFAYINPSIYWRAIMLISSIVWLFMLMRQPLEEASPRSYRVTLIIAMATLALPIVMEMISGLSLALGGEIFCFDSYAFKPWVRWIAPTMVLAHFVFPQIKAINTTRNSYCTPDSFDERSFNRNRAITICMVGLAILSFVLCRISVPAHEDYYIRHYHMGNYNDTMYHILQILSIISLCTLGISCIISWIMLSIMAFRQLPNPLGYKIFNIVCQVLTWGSLLTACLVPYGVDETFVILFFLSFVIFFVITAIRVISYSLPEETTN